MVNSILLPLLRFGTLFAVAVSALVALHRAGQTDAEWLDGKLQGAAPRRAPRHLFAGLRHARRLIAARRDDCNHNRPHTNLDGLMPMEYFNRSMKDQTRNGLNF